MADNKHISMESIINNSPVIVISRKVTKAFPIKYVSNNIKQFGYSPEDFYSGNVKYADLIHPDDRKVVLKAFKYLNEQLAEFIQEYRIVTRFGEIRYVEDRVHVKNHDERESYIDGIILDITERKHHELIAHQQKTATGKALSEISLEDVLGLLVTNAEKVNPGLKCAIMLLDNKKQHISHVIAPNLPLFFKDSMEGLEIGYGVCSSGTAVYMGERIIVDDIEKHPYWARHRLVAQQAGIRTSWADLIVASTGEILGTFVMYFDKPNKPKKACFEYLKANAALAAIEIEHRIVNETFRESEHRFKTIFNNINDQIYVSELNGNLLDVNKVVVDNLGYTKEFILKSSPMDIVPSWYVQRASELIKVIEREKKAIYEAAAICKDGSVIPLEVNARMIDYNGKKTILSVARDITERNKAEAALRESEKQFRALVSNIPGITYRCKYDIDWTMLYMSEEVTQISGYDAKNFINNSIHTYDSLIHEDDRDFVNNTIRNAVNVDKHWEAEYRIIHKDGNVRWVQEKGRAIKDESGVVRYLDGFIFDISERKRAENTKKLNQSRLEALIELNEMTVSSLDEIAEFVKEEAVRLTESKLGYIAFLNADETALIMHSWSNSAMSECGVSDRQFIYPIKTTGLWGEAVRQRKPVITNDYPAPNPLKKGYPDGHVQLTRHMNVPIIEGDQIVAVVGVGNKEEDYNESDVHQLTLLLHGMWKLIQRRQLIGALSKYSDELSKANTKLRSVNMIKAEFIEDSLKKDKGPLNKNDVLDDETLTLLEDSQKEAISVLLKNSEKIKRLIDTVLYTNLQRSGKIEYSFAPVNIGSVLSDALLNLILLVDEKELVLEKDIPTGLPVVKADKDKLKEVFIYLIHNAINLTPKGNSINVGVLEEDEYLHVTVKDTGEGIDQTIMPHLFSTMYQVNDSDKRMYQGLESSLYICKETIVAHQGTIWTESEVGKGSVFHVRLPKWKDEHKI